MHCSFPRSIFVVYRDLYYKFLVNITILVSMIVFIQLLKSCFNIFVAATHVVSFFGVFPVLLFVWNHNNVCHLVHISLCKNYIFIDFISCLIH